MVGRSMVVILRGILSSCGYMQQPVGFAANPPFIMAIDLESLSTVRRVV